MRRLFSLIVVLVVVFCTIGGAHAQLTAPPVAQTRVFGAQSFMMDDGLGHMYLLQAPTGMTGNLVYNFPLIPPGNLQQGFVTTGALDGQTLRWNGLLNYWEPSSFLFNSGTQLGINKSSGLLATLDVNGTFNVNGATTLGALTAGAGSLTSLNMNSGAITNLIDPIGLQDAATKNYVDVQVATATAAVTTETNRAMAAENTITTNLNNEVTRATGAENTLTTNLNNEVTNRTNAVTAEANARAAGDLLLLPLDGSRTMTGALNLGTHAITNVVDPTNPQDAATKNYVSGQIATTNAAITAETNRATNAENTITGNLNNEITRATGAENTLTTNLNNEITNRNTAVTNEANARAAADLLLLPLDGSRSMTGALNLNTHTITNVVDPTNPQDAATKNYVGNQVAAEATARANADATITTNLNNEVTRATGAENTLTTNLNNEVTRATGAENTLTTNLNNEVTNRTNAVTAEANARAAADLLLLPLDGSRTMTGALNLGTHAITNVVDPTNPQDAATKNYVSGQIATTNASITAETNRATNAENTITTNLNNEVTRATGAENTLTTNLNNEVTNRTNAVTAEANARAAADLLLLPLDGSRTMTGALNLGTHAITNVVDPTNPQDAATMNYVGNQVAAEATARANADATITTNLNNEVTRATGAENTLTTNLNNEVTNRTNAVTAEANARAAADLLLLPLDGSRTMTGALNLGTHAITNVVDPTNPQDAATKNYVSGQIATTNAAITAETNRATTAENTITGNLNNEITRATGAENTLTTNLNNEITNRNTAVTNEANARAAADLLLLPLDGSRSMTGALNLNTHTITNVVDPTNPQDAATKNYVGNQVAAEATARANADATITTNLNNEVTRATGAENTLTTNLNNEVTRATGAENTLTTNLNNEVTNRTNAVTAEANARAAADLLLLPLDGSRTMTGALNLGTHAITNVVDPTNPQDAATKNYVSGQIATTNASVTAETNRATTAENTLTTNLNNEITNRGTAVTNEANARAAADLLLLPLDGSRTMTGALNLGTHAITNVVDPTNPQDAATMNYVGNQVAAEATARANADATITTNLNNEVTRATGAENTLTTNLNNEVTNRTNAVTAEANARAAADLLLLPLDGSRTMTGALNLGTHAITNVVDPTNPQDAATKNYVSGQIATTNASVTAETNRATTAENTLTTNLNNEITNRGTAVTNEATARSNADLLLLPLDGSRTMTGSLNMGTQTITNVVDPTNAQDAATKNYVGNQVAAEATARANADATITTNLNNEVTRATAAELTKLPLAGGTMTGAINMGSNLITNVTDPVSAQDAATKNYVSGQIATTNASVTAETNRATSAENTISTNLTTETNRATAAELTKLPLAGGTMTGDINMGTHNITNAAAVTTQSLNLPTTSSATIGVINQNGALLIHTSGTNSYFAGKTAGNITATGAGNVGIGAAAMSSNVTGGSNTGVGASALNKNTTSFNTAVGNSALSNTTNGGFNTALGWGTGATNIGGTQNTFVGYGVDISAANLTNATALGANSFVGASNALVLGSINGVNSATADVNVGIGTTTPSQKLELKNGNLFLSNTSITGTAGQLQLQAAAGGNIATLDNSGTNGTFHMPGASGTLATTADVTASLGSYLPLSGGTMTGAIDMGSHLISNVSNPVSAQDAATKNYVTTAGNVAVSTNATLSGNGQTGTPLGLALGNANSWTGAQSFTAATNMGSTGQLSVNTSGNLITSGSVTIGSGAPILKDLTATGSLTFGATAAQTSSDLTITVTGAALGDPVFVGVPNAAVLANSSYSAWVSAANTVTVRFNNYSAASQTPAAAQTFRVVVMQF